MGGSFSAFNPYGLPGLTSATTGQVYDRFFKNKKTEDFHEFHIAYIELCQYFNNLMPGQDFDTPSREKIEIIPWFEFYEKEWKSANPREKRDRFFDFMEANVSEAKVDDNFFIMAGLAAPAAAVIGKRASGHIPYVKNLRLDLVPNVIFVPLFTLGAIMAATAAQISRKSAAAKLEEERATAKVEEERAATEQNKGESKK